MERNDLVMFYINSYPYERIGRIIRKLPYHKYRVEVKYPKTIKTFVKKLKDLKKVEEK